MAMVHSYLGSILEIANVFISLFVLIYAWSFLKQTQDVKDRKPWVFLFIAAVVFFAFEVVGILDVFELSRIPGLRNFLESMFIALILFVFIFQYDLILKSDLILITRKMADDDSEKKEAKIDDDLEKTLGKEQPKNKNKDKKEPKITTTKSSTKSSKRKSTKKTTKSTKKTTKSTKKTTPKKKNKKK